jgi:uncharacterized membrane protein
MLQSLAKYGLPYQIHIISGMVAFFVGPIQFISFIRRKWVALHILFGTMYLVCVVLSATTGFAISFHTPLKWAAAGTSIQCLLWLVSTVLAYWYIKQKEYRQHRKWMVRSFVILLAAPALRLEIIFLERVLGINYQYNFAFYYPLLVWSGFLPLVFLELFL